MKNRIHYINLFIAVLFVGCSLDQSKTNNSTEQIRLVSLVPSITKELVALGMKDEIVGATSYCEITKENKDLIVGTAVDVNIERVIMKKPTIVFVSTLVSAATIQALKQAKIKVYIADKSTSFNQICKQMIDLGKLVKQDSLAAVLVKNAKHTVDSLRLVNTHNKKVFFQIGAKPLFSVIPGTYMNDFITISGCTNISENLTKGVINREFVVMNNPDVIFVVTMGIVGEDEQNIWKQYNTMNAVKNNKIFILDSETACSPTLQDFCFSLTQITNNLSQ